MRSTDGFKELENLRKITVNGVWGGGRRHLHQQKAAAAKQRQHSSSSSQACSSYTSQSLWVPFLPPALGPTHSWPAAKWRTVRVFLVSSGGLSHPKWLALPFS